MDMVDVMVELEAHALTEEDVVVEVVDVAAMVGGRDGEVELDMRVAGDRGEGLRVSVGRGRRGADMGGF